MNRLLTISIVTFITASFAFAKSGETDKKQLIANMAKNCKAELAKAPAFTGVVTDGEAVWRNLESKENSSVRLSRKCHYAHEKYEHKYHNEEAEHEAGEHEG